MSYNLFVSHSWTYSDAYENLVSMLETESYFEYRNFSVPKNNPIHNAKNDAQLYSAIKNQMSYANVVLIMAGVYASYSKWIDKEIFIAKNEFSLPKKIIAIEPWGSEKTSQKVKNNADIIVGWNTRSIVKAIRELA